jgi:hypothetical protein
MTRWLVGGVYALVLVVFKIHPFVVEIEPGHWDEIEFELDQERMNSDQLREEFSDDKSCWESVCDELDACLNPWED